MSKEEFISKINGDSKDWKDWKVQLEESCDGKIIIGLKDDVLDFITLIIYRESTFPKEFKEFKKDILEAFDREVRLMNDFMNKVRNSN